jgi:hypothetical protein
MAEQLEIGAHGVTAILATWLGLMVLTRSARQAGARTFAFLAALLTLWSVAIIVERLTGNPAVATDLNGVEDASAFLLPAATLHVALSLTVEGQRSGRQQAVLLAT